MSKISLLPHGGPISYGFSGWVSVRDCIPKEMSNFDFLVCAIDGKKSVCAPPEEGEWLDARGVTVMAWAKVPLIDVDLFEADFAHRADT